MHVRASAVVRVIISGEWIWVEPGTFTVVDYSFTDDAGNVINRSREPAYHFISTNGDPYFGPLSAIQLIKLRPAALDATRDDEREYQGPHELPAAGESGTRADSPAAAPAPPGQTEDESEPVGAKKAAYSADDLFSDPVPGQVGGDTGGGLL